jgi:dTDP-glucose pyrophosphorylase
MDSLLGVLLCGGRGTRLGKITQYISKAFVPIYDRPVFMYPLAQLADSKYVDEIVILTNQDNDHKLSRIGYRTIIQDDERVHDMFSGLAYVRDIMRDNRPAVLMPCDNISGIRVDDTIEVWRRSGADIAINLRRIEEYSKRCEMGVFDPSTRKMVYRPDIPISDWGVIAPYVVKSELNLEGSTEQVINRHSLCWIEYQGEWFDIGETKSLAEAAISICRKRVASVDNPRM